MKSPRLRAAQVIEMLALEPHPEEGGFFRETYRSKERLTAAILAPRYREPGSGRSVSTAIYYLLTPDTFSELHIVSSDEVFHHYAGDPVEQLQLDPRNHSGGEASRIVVYGSDLESGQRPQGVVPAGVWQGARLVPGGDYGWALLGATVAPGFDYVDYRSGSRTELTTRFSEHATLIERLTHPEGEPS